jgi:alkylation response protein AidB-like acyl-CoA dehydrogenase
LPTSLDPPRAGPTGEPVKERTPMDFDFTEEQQAFREDVIAFIEESHDPEVMDVTRENMSQLVDTPKRRAFMKKIGERGWLGMTWPKEYGGSEGEGVYEFILNEELARVGAPQIGKGVGIIGKTLIRHGSEKLKREFLPKILVNDVEFAVGYSEPQAGSDAAAMELKAVYDAERKGWVMNGQKIFTTSAHFADWYWVGARTDPDKKKHVGISLFVMPMDQPGLEIQRMPTIGDEITNQVFFNDCFVHEDYMVGEQGKGFRYISEALDLERFTMFTYAPIDARLKLLQEHVRTTTCDGEPLKDDVRVRGTIARLTTEAEVARCLGIKFVNKSMKGGAAPTVEASQYKLFATEFSKKLASSALDVVGAGGQLRVHTEEGPMQGRNELTYRYTVIDTVGGGASEIQKNIIARRGLGLPKNF